jgi:hypothetical protein
MDGKQNFLCVIQQQILVPLQALKLGWYSLHQTATLVLTHVFLDAIYQDG